MNAFRLIVDSFEAGAAEHVPSAEGKFYRSGYGAAHLDEEKIENRIPPR